MTKAIILNKYRNELGKAICLCQSMYKGGGFVFIHGVASVYTMSIDRILLLKYINNFELKNTI